MANTTFSGPVRSENGFQEWDGTAWVPVAGGGGGGGSAVVLTPNQLNTVTFTEVGQIIDVVYRGLESTSLQIVVNVPEMPPLDYTEVILLYTNPESGTFVSNDYSTLLPWSSGGLIDVKLVLAGIKDTGTYGVRAYVMLTGVMSPPSI